MEREVMAVKSRRSKGKPKGKGPTPKAKDRPYHKAAAKKSGPKRKPDSKSGARSDKRRDGSRRDSSSRDSSSRDSSRRDNNRGKRETRVYVDTIAGRNAVVEALRAEVDVKEILVALGVDVDDRMREIVAISEERGIPLREVARSKIETLSGISNHQGVLIVAKPFPYSSQQEIFQRAKSPALFIAVDGVTDPRNIGAIIRSAAAFGADGLLIPERRSASMTASAWKASAGAAARLPIAQITNLTRSIEDAKAKGCFVVGLDGGASDEISNLAVATEPLYIVVGSEGKGLSRLVQENCDLLVSIPMRSEVESLNASVALSIALFSVSEARKRAE
jgi:23S rRNA (guanosine2251-2'-O)-methyltransferase